jgi:predicted phosphodiesterase
MRSGPAALAALVLAAAGGRAAAAYDEYTGPVIGLVYDDANANGWRDPGEAGLPGVLVSDGVQVMATGPDGGYQFMESSSRRVFVIEPGDRRTVGSWFRDRQALVDFALAPAPAPEEWRFAHLSDTHVHEGNQPQLRAALAQVAEQGVDLALVTGDLVRDALRVDERSARAQFALYMGETARVPFRLKSVLGNHDVFGIERQESLVPATHPAYGKALYQELLGPRYYAFNRGRVHVLVLDTVDVDDTVYYGHLDEAQLAWIRKELAQVPAGTTVITAGHIPLRTGALSLAFAPEGAGRTLQTVGGQAGYRHVVRNTSALAEILKPYRWTLALQGHTHLGEALRLQDGGSTRYHTAPAVDAQAWAPWPTGFVVYTVRGDTVDDGRFVPVPAR